MPKRVTVVLVSLLLATPFLMSWLRLVIVPYKVTKLCPQECWCDIGGYWIDCSGKSLHSIPSVYFTHVQELVLNDNNITSLERDSFISKEMTELDILALGRCGLQTIELGAFNGLTKLTFLSMRENVIREITGRTFEEMSGLEYLDLQYNNIEHLDADLFSGLINLQSVLLDGNKLLKIHPDLFVGLAKFEALSLSSNEGLQIPTDSHFITSHSLSQLDVSGCNVSSVSVETFANVSALEMLDLSSNNLSSIDINILKSLPKLSALPLYGNRLQCDCQLKEVWRWCQDHDIYIAFEEQPVCDTPSEGYVTWQGVLEKLQCLRDYISDENGNKHVEYAYPGDENKQTLKKYFIMVLVPTIFLLIFGTFGNVIILIIIICNKDMRTVPNMYILNLAISNMILLTSEFIWNSVEFDDEIKCTFLPFCYRMSIGLSAYSVVALSFQRQRVTMKAFHVFVSSAPTWCVTVATICGVWIVATLFAIPSALSKFICFDPPLLFKNIAYYKRVVIFELFVSCLLPLVLIAFAVIMAARHLVESSCSILVSEEAKIPQMNTRKNDAKIVIGLSVVFLITYVPFHVWWTHIIFSLPRKFELINGGNYTYRWYNLLLIKIISGCLLLINSCLNPVAIFCSSLEFRKYFKRYLN
jgi:Leucine-rich repeat (LRR) protein